MRQLLTVFVVVLGINLLLPSAGAEYCSITSASGDCYDDHACPGAESVSIAWVSNVQGCDSGASVWIEWKCGNALSWQTLATGLSTSGSYWHDCIDPPCSINGNYYKIQLSCPNCEGATDEVILGPITRVCVEEDDEEACLTHGMSLAGRHTWALWNEEFWQTTEIVDLGDDSLCYRLTNFIHYSDAGDNEWVPPGGFFGEYQISYGWAEDEYDTLNTATCEDGLSYLGWDLETVDSGDSSWVDLRIGFEQETEPLELHLFYRAHTDGYLETWSRATNTESPGGDILFVRHTSSLSRELSPQSWAADTTAWGREWVQYAGHGYCEYRTRYAGEHATLTSTSGVRPWCAIRQDTTAGGEEPWLRTPGFAVGLIPFAEQPWTIAFQTELDQPKDSLRVTIYNAVQTGSTEEDFRERTGEWRGCVVPQRVLPEMSTEGDHAFFMFTDGTLADASERTHDFVRNHYQPPPPADPSGFPPVRFITYFWNDWEYQYGNLLEQADTSAALGVELFMLDANWNKYSLFDPTPMPPPYGFQAYRRGSGYWVGDSCRFNPPDKTLVDVIDSLNTLGMEAGLWIYPASIDATLLLDEASLPCWEPDPPPGKPCFCEGGNKDLACQVWDLGWYAEYYDAPECEGDYWRQSNPTSSGCPWLELEDPDSLYLGEVCCAHEDSRDWVKAQLARLLDPDKYGASYLKFDGGTHPCYSTDHTHRMALFPGDTEELRFQDPCLGMSQIQRELLDEYPGTIFQAGWPRGHVQEGEDLWPQDQVPYLSRYSMESLRCHTLPQYSGTFLYQEPDVFALPANQATALRKYYMRTAMLSPISISCDILVWSEEFTEIVKEAITYYKDHRAIFRGEAYNVVEQRGFCDHPPCQESWDAVQFLDPGTGDSRVFVFRAEHETTPWTVPLQGLDPEADYDVTSVDGHFPGDTYTGAELMQGISINLPYERCSEILEVELQP